MHPFDTLTAAVQTLAASPWLPLALAVLCALDGLLPVVPSETAVLTAAVLAATAPAGPHPAAVVAAAALGSFAGDLLCYALARRLPAPRRPGRRAAALRSARALLARRGGPVILTARFLPSGRTAVSLAAGATGLPARTFRRWSAAASLCWAVYTLLLGLLGGGVGGGNPLVGTAVGLGAGLTVSAVVTAVRRYRGGAVRRRRASIPVRVNRPVVDVR